MVESDNSPARISQPKWKDMIKDSFQNDDGMLSPTSSVQRLNEELKYNKKKFDIISTDRKQQDQ